MKKQSKPPTPTQRLHKYTDGSPNAAKFQARKMTSKDMTLETFQRILEELGNKLISNLTAIISPPVKIFLKKIIKNN